MPYAFAGTSVQELSSDQCSVRLISLLYQCASEVAAGEFDRANLCLEHIMQLASLDAPHTLQRLAAVFADALACKLLKLLPGLSRALLSSSSSADVHQQAAIVRHNHQPSSRRERVDHHSHGTTPPVGRRGMGRRP